MSNREYNIINDNDNNSYVKPIFERENFPQ